MNKGLEPTTPTLMVCPDCKSGVDPTAKRCPYCRKNLAHAKEMKDPLLALATTSVLWGFVMTLIGIVFFPLLIISIPTLMFGLMLCFLWIILAVMRLILNGTSKVLKN